MRRRLLNEINTVLIDLNPDRAALWRVRAGSLARDCGCAMGGVFVLATLMLFAPVLFLLAGVSSGTVVIFIVTLLVSAGAGKALGIGVATLRLNRLARRVRGAASSTRVTGRNVHMY
jgi:hypothetical protein